MDQSFVCPVCAEVMDPAQNRHPIALPCSHTICQKCVSDSIQTPAKKRTSKTVEMDCPRCFKQCTIDVKKGLVPHMVNNKLVDMFEKAKLKQAQQKDVSKNEQTTTTIAQKQTELCRYCEELEATKECENCKEYFCDSCCEILHSRGTFKTHTIAPFTSETQINKVKRYCLEHESEKLTLYCETDKTLCCSICCLAGKHKGHQVKVIKEAFGEVNNRVEQKISVLKEKKKILLQTSNDLQAVIKKLKVENDHAEDVIREKLNEIQAMLNDKKKQLFVEKTQKFQNQLAHAEKHSQDCSEFVKRADQYLSQFESAQAQQPSAEVMDNVLSLEKKVEDDIAIVVATTPKEYAPLSKSIRINTSKVMDEIKNIKLFERIADVFQWSPKNCHPYLAISSDGLSLTCRDGSAWPTCFANMGFTSGVHYWELQHFANDPFIGVATAQHDLSKYIGATPHSWAINCSDGKKYQGGMYSPYLSNFKKIEKGQTIGILLDMDKGTLTLYIDGTCCGIAFSDIKGEVFPCVSLDDPHTVISLVANAKYVPDMFIS